MSTSNIRHVDEALWRRHNVTIRLSEDYEIKNGYRVVDIDTHVNPSYDTLVKYVDPSFRSRLDELKPYLRTVGSYTALSMASIPFDGSLARRPRMTMFGRYWEAAARWRDGFPRHLGTTGWTQGTGSAMKTPRDACWTWTWKAGTWT